MKRETRNAGTAAACLALTALFCAAALAETKTPQFNGSIAAKQENQQTLRLAKTTLLDAVATANAQQPVGQVVEAALEVENGFLVYGIDILGASGTQTKAFVDAGNGKLLATFADEKDTDNVQVEEEDNGNGGEQPDANEKPEATGSEMSKAKAEGDRDSSDKTDLTALEASTAKVPLNDAVRTALTATPGTAVGVRLDNEKGTLAYKVRILSSSGKLTRVAVNAITGKVITTAQKADEKNENEND